MSATDIRAAVFGYLHRGLVCVPVPAREKGPKIKGWIDLRIGDEGVEQYFAPDSNVGIILGTVSGGIVDIDLDSPEARQLASAFLPLTAMVHGRPGSPRSHFWYKTSPAPSPAKFSDPAGKTLVELRSNGQQTIVAPSIHPSGERVAWEREGEPTEIAPRILATAVRKLAAATLLARAWPAEGSRHQCALATSGMLLRCGWSENDVAHFIEAVAHGAGDTEARDRRKDVYTTARRIAGDGKATGATSLAQIIGKENVARIQEWLRLKEKSTPQPTPKLNGNNTSYVPGTIETIETEAIWESIESVAMVSVEWLWPERIPRALCSFVGNPDVGKSVVALDFVARVSTGSDFPDAPNHHGPQRVLLLVAEDAIADTVVPRLVAGGADLSKIEFLAKVEIRQGARREEREFALDEDLKHLEAKLTGTEGIALVICDTISSYLGKAEMTKEQAMRRVLLPMRTMCEKHRIAFVGINHLNKRSDVRAIQRSAGAMALVGVPRASWIFGEDPDRPGDFLMLRHKGNLTKVRTGLSYTLVDTPVGKDIHGKDVSAPRVLWRDEPITGSADELLSVDKSDERKRDKATNFLLEFLAKGPRQTSEVEAECDRLGLGRATMWRAKKESPAQIFTYRNGLTWWWSLTPKPRK